MAITTLFGTKPMATSPTKYEWRGLMQILISIDIGSCSSQVFDIIALKVAQHEYCVWIFSVDSFHFNLVEFRCIENNGTSIANGWHVGMPLHYELYAESIINNETNHSSTS